MGAGGDRRDAVEYETCWASPDGYVAVFDADSAGSVGAAEGSAAEGCGKAERDGDDGLGVVLLVLVRMEREACAGFVAVDETVFWGEVWDASAQGSAGVELSADGRLGRSGFVCGGID